MIHKQASIKMFENWIWQWCVLWLPWLHCCLHIRRCSRIVPHSLSTGGLFEILFNTTNIMFEWIRSIWNYSCICRNWTHFVICGYKQDFIATLLLYKLNYSIHLVTELTILIIANYIPECVWKIANVYNLFNNFEIKKNWSEQQHDTQETNTMQISTFLYQMLKLYSDTLI